MSQTAEAAPRHITGFGSRAYRSYVLNALLLVYVLNFMDRALLSVVAPRMKPELGISDTAFGLLTGFGFALLYTLVGVPLAQVAERRHRVWIMSVCVALWSLMTALCGLASEVTIGAVTIGAFWVLLACRVGVGIGEAGCTPPANSLIADYFPPTARSTALGYYAMGVALGGLLANLIGGPITDAYGWRTAFFALGAPGIVIAILFKLTVREPPRGYSDPPGVVRAPRPRFSEALKVLARKPAFWTMTAGATAAAFCGYGIASFQSLFLSRSFGLSAGEAALTINAPVALAQAAGALATGWFAEKLAARHPNAIAWLPGAGLILSVPFYWLAFTTGNLGLCLFALCVGGAVKFGYNTAQYAIGQAIVPPPMRAVTTAILLLVVNLLGYGFGPLFIGGVSDLLFHVQVADLGAGHLTRSACEGAARAALAASDQGVCAIAHPQSLECSLLVTATLYTLSGAFFLLTCRYLARDTVMRG